MIVSVEARRSGGTRSNVSVDGMGKLLEICAVSGALRSRGGSAAYWLVVRFPYHEKSLRKAAQWAICANQRAISPLRVAR